ncbi:hypothetical protein DH2020_034105 [Rehmannia glutinosa]|uniref:Late embryogenesis abundant protein LEA-2 subgroup domain-containing protein n=1 Tax=Rehmannia glutinosa TaxID=99300 RepID=A0ABR0VDJ4_REHGL
MAENNNQQSVHRTKVCILFISLLVVSQTGVVLLFTLTILKFRTPKLSVQTATFETLNVGTPTNPLFKIRMNAEIIVKNTNFGRFKFDNTQMHFFHRGTRVATYMMPNGVANGRSTKKIGVAVDMTMASGASQGINSQLASDLRAGVVPITCQGKMRGNVRLMVVLKKNKSADMNCSLDIVMTERCDMEFRGHDISKGTLKNLWIEKLSNQDR